MITALTEIVRVSTHQHWVVSAILSGVQSVGHQSLQQGHPQAERLRKLGLHNWTQLPGVSGQNYLKDGESNKKYDSLPDQEATERMVSYGQWVAFFTVAPL